VVRGALILAYLRVYLSDQPAREVVPVYLVGFRLRLVVVARVPRPAR